MWQPNQEGVKELINLLGESSSPDNEKQTEIFKVNF